MTYCFLNLCQNILFIYNKNVLVVCYYRCKRSGWVVAAADGWKIVEIFYLPPPPPSRKASAYTSRCSFFLSKGMEKIVVTHSFTLVTFVILSFVHMVYEKKKMVLDFKTFTHQWLTASQRWHIIIRGMVGFSFSFVSITSHDKCL